jgi:proteasome lid subunit RPN8/RPN11
MICRTLIVSSQAIAELGQALDQIRGRELGGLLLEDDAGNQHIRLAPNLMSEPGAFAAPAWWFENMLGKRDGNGFVPVAFFHTHTSSLELSDRDRESMKRLRLPWIVFKRENIITCRIYSSLPD